MSDRNSVSTDMSSFRPAVRFDLREPAFRKYERYIADACIQSIMIEVPIKVLPRTFAYRIRDAILGYTRYGYRSEWIPKGFDVSVLKVQETADGRVAIINSAVVNQELAWQNVQARDIERVKEFCEKLFLGHIRLPSAFVYYDNAAQRDMVMAWMKDAYPFECGYVTDEGTRLKLI